MTRVTGSCEEDEGVTCDQPTHQTFATNELARLRRRRRKQVLAEMEGRWQRRQ